MSTSIHKVYVSQQDYNKWKMTVYYKNNKDGQPLRLGQAFLNHFYPTVQDPTLFYCRDIKQADARIHEFYLTNDELT